jgi:hypothetical protein
MAGIREFFRTPAGQATAAGLLLVAVAAFYFSFRNTFGESEAAHASRHRTFICSQTGRTFTYTLRPGDSIPVHSPHSRSNTGYPPEYCYWTADGEQKTEPTIVLLNQYKGGSGPTFCPDCDRLVVQMNPPPSARPTAPPTSAQYRPGMERDLE